jgi:hypothetical protein
LLALTAPIMLKAGTRYLWRSSRGCKEYDFRVEG